VRKASVKMAKGLVLISLLTTIPNLSAQSPQARSFESDLSAARKGDVRSELIVAKAYNTCSASAGNGERAFNR
jgi:hypothetical protein